jgi:hypothetical protein
MRIGSAVLRATRNFMSAVPGSIKHHLNMEELARITVASVTTGGGFFGFLQAVVTSASTLFLSPTDAALVVAILTLVLETHRRLGHGTLHVGPPADGAELVPAATLAKAQRSPDR